MRYQLQEDIDGDRRHLTKTQRGVLQGIGRPQLQEDIHFSYTGRYPTPPRPKEVQERETD